MKKVLYHRGQSYLLKDSNFDLSLRKLQHCTVSSTNLSYLWGYQRNRRGRRFFLWEMLSAELSSQSFSETNDYCRVIDH